MAISIASNIASLKAQRQLTRTGEELATVYQRLSSGMRINRASDDPAGLAIADSLKSDVRVFSQGIRNLNDGISLLNIADSAVESLSSIVMRLKELAEQSANGTYSYTQRKALDTEAQALSKEYLRTIQSTKFNGVNILSANFSELRLQAGYGINGSISSNLGGTTGSGSFATGANYATEAGQSTGIELADLNGDGHLDMITAGNSDAVTGYFTVRLGDGSGSFGQASSYSVLPGNTRDLEVGDVNQDGIMDILVVGQSASSGLVSISLGTGQGSFGASYTYQTEATYSVNAALGDLNNDGLMDLITSGTASGTSGFATVRLGTGGGAFGAATSYLGVAGISYDVKVGDINNDGILDLVQAGVDSGAGSANVRLGNGDGSFGAGITYSTEGHRSDAVYFADANNDGNLDLLSAGLATAGGVGVFTIRLGNGNGTFGNALSYVQEAGESRDLTVGDINGDGILDIVTGGTQVFGGGLGVATIRLGIGNGTFGNSISILTESSSSLGVALGDLNHDGVLDLVSGGEQIGFNGFATVHSAIVRNGTSALLPFDLKSIANARAALIQFDDKLKQLVLQRGQIGAFETRVNIAVSNLDSARTAFAAAESRIRDADIAEEATNLVRLQIKQQAAVAILAQANLQSQLALNLLSENG